MPARRLGFQEVDALRRHLLAGGVVAIPTESSYGLAADPRSPEGVAAIYGLKARERGKPLPVVLADRAQAADLGVDVTAPAVRWAERHWPAPLTVLAPLLEEARGLPAAAGSSLLAIRVPAHGRLRRLLGELGFGLTATSANRSGEPALTDPAVLQEWLPATTLLLEDGVLPGGAPSTVVGWSAARPVVHRRGRFPL